MSWHDLAKAMASGTTESKAVRALGGALAEAVDNGTVSQTKVDLAAWLVSEGVEASAVSADNEQQLWASTMEALMYALFQKTRAFKEKRACVWKGQMEEVSKEIS